MTAYICTMEQLNAGMDREAERLDHMDSRCLRPSNGWLRCNVDAE